MLTSDIGKSAPLYIIEKMKALEGKTWWDTFAKPYDNPLILIFALSWNLRLTFQRIHGFWLFYGLITWLITAFSAVKGIPCNAADASIIHEAIKDA